MHGSRTPRRFLTVAVVALGQAALLPACRHAPPPGDPNPVVRLAIPGRASATPSIAIAGDFIAVAWGATTPDGRSDVFLAVSRDGGRTFGSPTLVNTAPGEARLSGESPPRVAVSHTVSGGDPDVTVVWTSRDPLSAVKIARSRDGGRTFAPAASLSARDAPGNRGWPALVVDSSGVARAIWLDHRGMVSKNEPNAAHHHTTAPTPTAEAAEAAVAMAQKSGLYLASYDGEPAAEREVARGVCYCCKTAIAAAADGSLVAAWRHVYAGNMRDIAFTRIRPNGAIDPVARVSEDKWSVNGCPDDGPALAIDGAGTAHVIWPTVLPGEPVLGALFYAEAPAGGGFSPRVQVPTLGGRKPSHPQIAVDGRGRVAVAWDEQSAGERIAAMRLVLRDASGAVTFGPATRFGAGDIALYPALVGAADGFVAAWTRGAGDSSTIAIERLPAR